MNTRTEIIDKPLYDALDQGDLQNVHALITDANKPIDLNEVLVKHFSPDEFADSPLLFVQRHKTLTPEIKYTLYAMLVNAGANLNKSFISRTEWQSRKKIYHFLSPVTAAIEDKDIELLAFFVNLGGNLNAEHHMCTTFYEGIDNHFKKTPLALMTTEMKNELSAYLASEPTENKPSPFGLFTNNSSAVAVDESESDEAEAGAGHSHTTTSPHKS